ncbi:MAG: cellulose biosynthesis cyclic di-GMP-binding regulatory protein BcsB [Zhongshania sp.]|uniref:cellulose biosynthesis cyclic di-GMP-binding regulatory protein BcsB n=1 Tax=Zhongshania sp. TaxID=1971902 RepID=UPI0026283BD5|nr:cellulose biosynthesis cyclic di-GMP-binding regulatory protein BcsB [Zhongshania sp.]MDF1693784.1 cellulose biosynthesis cyclic di-GMP-binding regulatory protein BcsB [Zhongshania sp.]
MLNAKILSLLGLFIILSPFCFAEDISKAEEIDPSLVSNTMTFTSLGFANSIDVQGSESSIYLGFGSRLDRLVTDAELKLDFISSPALTQVLSHLKIYLNGELQHAVQITEQNKGQRHRVTLPLDSRYLSDYNQLRIELVGHLDKECWNPSDPSIWVEISQASEVVLNSRRVRLSNDLSILPAPFFDHRDFGKLTLPVVFGPKYQLDTVYAATIAASYFGSQAKWRGVNFPVLINQPPEQHAIVMLTNDNRPAFLADYPLVDKPTIQIINHPDKPYVKLLLIQGRDSEQLLTAVRGLALGTELMSGPIATITNAEQIQARQPYDAPNWIRTDRPVTLGELVNDPKDLQVEGRKPSDISVSLRVPPDLFTWQSRGIPLDLRYRYSPPASNSDDSNLSMSINGQFVEAFSLTTTGINGEAKRVRVPLLDDSLMGGSDRIRIPAFQVGSLNQMNFRFAFAAVNEGACQTIPAGSPRAIIEADSTLDFSGYPHYIEMPNLQVFATAGYPFTRMADLSDTAVVIPPSPSPLLIQSLLETVGYFSASAAYPGIGLVLLDNWEPSRLANKDILTIGVDPSMAASSAEQDLPALLWKKSQRSFDRPQHLGNTHRSPLAKTQAWTTAEQVSVNANGAFGALIGMQSPYNDSRSIVALLGTRDQDLLDVSRSLNTPGRMPYIYGSVALFRGDSVASYNVGKPYYVGHLPLQTLIWYHFSKHPFILAACALLLVVLISITLWRLLAVVAARRLREGDDE